MSRRDRINQQAEKAAIQAAAAVSQSQPEVSEKGPANIEPPRPRNEPRRLAMEEIEQRDLQSKADEGMDLNNDAPKAAPKVETKVETKEEPVKVEPVEAAEIPVETPIPETVKVKIDGVESEVAKSEVEEYGGVKAYQISKAAEKRLKEANEAVAQSKQTQAQLLQWVQQQQKPKVPQQTTDQLIAEKIDVIRYGTPEESAAALREVMEKSTTRVDPNSIEQRIMAQIGQREGVKSFVTEFADLAANPLAMKLALTLEKEKLSNAQAVADWPMFYRQIGNEIRTAFGRPNQPANAQTTGTTSQPSSEKEARKASIVNLPASPRAELPKEEKPETRTDVLNSMRKARGIPTG